MNKPMIESSISIEEDRVIFQGSIESIDNSLIELLNNKLLYESRLTFDFTGLSHLKAKVLSALAEVVYKSPRYITIKTNEKYSWQQPVISAFKILNPAFIKVITLNRTDIAFGD